MYDAEKQDMIRLLCRYQAEQLNEFDMRQIKTEKQKGLVNRLAWTQILISDTLAELLGEAEARLGKIDEE